MLHHISLPVRNLVEAGTFYDAVLAPLGYRRVGQSEDFIGYGVEDGKDKFALKSASEIQVPGPGFHLAFAAQTYAQVDAFYRVAMTQGARDNGPAGLRPDYGPHYYAAFVFDLDGYLIEAVCTEAV